MDAVARQAVQSKTGINSRASPHRDFAVSKPSKELCFQDAPTEYAMMDALMLALAFFFFAAAIGYTYACERL